MHLLLGVLGQILLFASVTLGSSPRVNRYISSNTTCVSPAYTLTVTTTFTYFLNGPECTSSAIPSPNSISSTQPVTTTTVTTWQTITQFCPTIGTYQIAATSTVITSAPCTITFVVPTSTILAGGYQTIGGGSSEVVVITVQQSESQQQNGQNGLVLYTINSGTVIGSSTSIAGQVNGQNGQGGQGGQGGQATTPGNPPPIPPVVPSTTPIGVASITSATGNYSRSINSVTSNITPSSQTQTSTTQSQTTAASGDALASLSAAGSGLPLLTGTVAAPTSCPSPGSDQTVFADGVLGPGIPSAAYYPVFDSTGTIVESLDIKLDGDTSGATYQISTADYIGIFASDGSSFIINFAMQTATYTPAGCQTQIVVDLDPLATSMKRSKKKRSTSKVSKPFHARQIPPSTAFQVTLNLINQCGLPSPFADPHLLCQLTYIVPGRGTAGKYASSITTPYQDFISQGDGTYIGYCGASTAYYDIDNGCNALLNSLRLICPTGRFSTLESLIIQKGGKIICARIALAAATAAAETVVLGIPIGLIVNEICTDMLSLYNDYCTGTAITAELDFCNTLASLSGSGYIAVTATDQDVAAPFAPYLIGNVEIQKLADISATTTITDSMPCDDFCPGLAAGLSKCDVQEATCLLGLQVGSDAYNACTREHDLCSCQTVNEIENPCIGEDSDACAGLGL